MFHGIQMKTIVKIGIFLLLAAAVFYGTRRMSISYNIPPQMTSYCEEANYSLNIRDDSLEGKAVFRTYVFRQGEFKLLSSQVALASVRVDGQERPVFEKDGFFFIFMERKKESVIDFNFAKKFQGLEEKYSLELAVPRAARNKIELRGIGGQHVVFNGLQFNESDAQDRPDKILAVIYRCGTEEIKIFFDKTHFL